MGLLGMLCRGVVVPESGEAPFRQMFSSWNGAPVTVYDSRRSCCHKQYLPERRFGIGALYMDAPK